MVKRIEAIVKPSLLVWARESIGLSLHDAAKKIRVKEDRLEGWERGDAVPTVGQLRIAANVYKRPLAVFYLQSPPKEKKGPRDFRRLDPEEIGHTSPGLSLAVRNALRKRDVALDLAQELGETLSVRVPHFRMSGGAEHVAAKARESLGVALEDQFRWRDPYEALKAWISAIEDQGVLVFQMSGVKVHEARAFSIASDVLPVLSINGKDSPRARIFSLLHEYAHIVLNKSGLCDFEDDGTDIRARIEQFCNYFAGAALVPQESLLNEDAVKGKRLSEWEEHELADLSQKYSVSREVILRRLLILGRTTPTFYKRKRNEYLQELQRLSSQQSGFLLPHRRAVRDNGKTFTEMVLRAYREEAITGSSVADYLGVRLKHLDRIEVELS